MALTEKLTAIAEAIRGKTGKMDGLTLDQMVAEISGIESGGGEEFFVSSFGVGYTANMVSDCTKVGCTWHDANNLKSLALTEWNPTNSTRLEMEGKTSGNDLFNSSGLETLLLPKVQYCSHYWMRNATGLKTVQIGSVGYPILAGIGSLCFRGCEQTGLTITVYADAATLASAQEAAGAPPWGATNATVIFRNSTTGEAITE